MIFWFVIVVIAIALGLINTVFMSIFERTQELGLLQALGLSPTALVIQVIAESCLLLAVGAILANLVALSGIIFLHDGIDISSFSKGTGKFGLRSIIVPIVVYKDWVIANALSFGLGLVATLYPSWQASRLVPANALARPT